jgi:hypothetical protein
MRLYSRLDVSVGTDTLTERYVICAKILNKAGDESADRYSARTDNLVAPYEAR